MKERVAKVSILVNVFLASIKIFVGLLSYSGAVFAEGIHSLMDIFASFVSYLGIKFSLKPADEKHPFGHYFFEVFAGIFISLILGISSFFIIWEAFQKIINPSPIQFSFILILAMLASALINEIMARLKIHWGKKEDSVALISDGLHSKVDVYTSLTVFIGLILSKYFSLPQIDSLLAILIGIYIFRQSFILLKDSIESLIGVSLGKEIEGKIKEIIKKENIEIDFLKTQKLGSNKNIYLGISLPAFLKIGEVSKIIEDLRKKIINEIKNVSFLSIQVKSHNLEENFWGTFLKRGFCWRKGLAKGRKLEEGIFQGKGLKGYCICLKCGYKIEHQRGVPCSSLTCPNCHLPLKRE